MNLGFDIDGVIADFSQALLETIKKNYGLALNKTDIYCFDLNVVLGLPKSEGKQLIVEVLQKDLPLNTGAKETLEQRKRHTIHSTASFKRREKVPCKSRPVRSNSRGFTRRSLRLDTKSQKCSSLRPTLEQNIKR